MPAPLQQKRILITREESQAKDFTEKVLRFGGDPVEIPLLQITCTHNDLQEKTMENIDQYSWIFFTSANGVHCFFQKATTFGLNLRSLDHLKIAVVGHKTENALKEFGYTAQFTPSTYNAEAMASEFMDLFSVSRPVLLIRGNRSSNVLPKEFSRNGIPFDTLEVYETIFNYTMKQRLNELVQKNDIDFLTFTSPSTVEAFMALKEGDKQLKNLQILCVCIGTTTERKAVEMGFTNTIIPNEFTIDGMIAAMRNYLNQEG